MNTYLSQPSEQWQQESQRLARAYSMDQMYRQSVHNRVRAKEKKMYFVH
jgi:hypothetical protein